MKNASIILLLLVVHVSLGAPPKVNYPVRFVYINSINSWSSQNDILAGMGVPGFAPAHTYNYVALAFWSFVGPLDMAKVWDDPVQFIKPHPQLGSTKDAMQKAIKKKYNDAGISLMVSAFGATQMPTSRDPVAVATSLATWVQANNLDGVDIDYEDNDAMTLSTAEQWLISFQKKLRELLPNHLITHAPQSPYFSTTQYRKGGYITVHNAVGSTIDFYNIQFYNQGGSTYDSYTTLFKVSNGWSTGTAVKQMIDAGIPSNKIVVGKPATQADAANTGTVNNADLGAWCLQAYREFGWNAGVMFWQYRNDMSGTHVKNAAGQLMNALGTTSSVVSSPANTGNSTGSVTNSVSTPSSSTSTSPSPVSTGTAPIVSPPPVTIVSPPPVSTVSAPPVIVPPSGQRVSYPVRLVYVNGMTGWWPATTIAAGLGVPGYAKNHTYNYIALAFWTNGAAADAAKVWQNPTMFMGTDSVFGKTDNDIRASLKKAYNNAGIKLLVSAFGATENPTGKDPIAVATNLAKFVVDYSLDGCDIDYEDNAAMEAGVAEAWLISFTKKLRELLPTQIITHAPQGPYFKSEYYPKGAYVTINREVGSLIDFYNVQFYNQGNTQYNTYNELFIKATGFFSNTSVKQIIARGVPSNKIVVGKPAAQADAMNTGLVTPSDLGAWTSRAYSELGWYAGVMFWQYRSDLAGTVVSTATSNLVTQFQNSANAVKPNTPATSSTTSNTALNTGTSTSTITVPPVNTGTSTTTVPAVNTTTKPTNTSTTTVPPVNTGTTPATNTSTKPTNTSTTTSTVPPVNTGTSTTTVPPVNTGSSTVPPVNTGVPPVNTGTSTSTPTPVAVKPSSTKVSYPVRFVYVDYLNVWWPATAIAAAIGVPGYAKKHSYNYVALAFWSYTNGPLDIANIWTKPTYFLGTESVFGSTDASIRANLKKAYNSAGVRVLVSAFGSTEMPTNQNPVDVATKLARFVLDYNFDGCDIDYEDNHAMEIGTGQAWLISFTRKLRELLPTQTITHAPQAPYFKNEYYPKGGYYTVDKEVGSLIDFYNVQFYNQGDTQYNTYNELFIKATGFFSNTSVKQIIARGVPSNKIVVGKPAAQGDVMNTGLVSLTDLGTWTARAYKELGWYAGVMLWQYRNDISGTGIASATSSLLTSCIAAGIPANPPQLSASQESSELPGIVMPKTRVNYPVRLTWINSLASWWPAESILASMGVPGQAKDSQYNYISYSFWTYELGATGAAAVWNDPITYLGTESGLGVRKSQVQTSIMKKFKSMGVKVLISAFGPFEMPTSKGINPLACAKKLARFVQSNQLDGVDINYSDDSAIAAGTAQLWLQAFSQQLRKLLPNSVICHSVKPSYFRLSGHGYNQVNKQVGDTIDFYNILYMYEPLGLYDSYDQIFGDTSKAGSIKQLSDSGIPLYKLVAASQLSNGDLSNNGWVKPQDLGQWTLRALDQFKWYAGISLYEYRLDSEGLAIASAAADLARKFDGANAQDN